MPVFIYYPHQFYGFRYIAPAAHVVSPYGYHYLYPTYIPFTNPAAAIPSDYADLLDVALATHLNNLPAVLGHP